VTRSGGMGVLGGGSSMELNATPGGPVAPEDKAILHQGLFILRPSPFSLTPIDIHPPRTRLGWAAPSFYLINSTGTE